MAYQGFTPMLDKSIWPKIAKPKGILHDNYRNLIKVENMPIQGWKYDYQFKLLPNPGVSNPNSISTIIQDDGLNQHLLLQDLLFIMMFDLISKRLVPQPLNLVWVLSSQRAFFALQQFRNNPFANTTLMELFISQMRYTIESLDIIIERNLTDIINLD